MGQDVSYRFNSFMKKIHMINKPSVPTGGLYRSEFFMLIVIKKHEASSGENYEGIKPSEIAELTGSSISAASKQIKTVEEKGYIERRYSKNDKRVVYITLTDKGRNILSQAKKERDKKIAAIIEAIGEEKMSTFLDIGEEILQFLENDKVVI